LTVGQSPKVPSHSTVTKIFHFQSFSSGGRTQSQGGALPAPPPWLRSWSIFHTFYEYAYSRVMNIAVNNDLNTIQQLACAARRS